MAATLEDLADAVRAALGDGNLDAYQELLDPDVRWGPPDDPEWGCKNRRQVLTWYQAAQDRGMAASVNEVVPGDGCLLVGLTVSGPPAAEEPSGTVERWQILTVKDGRISDIRGFDDRETAAARAGVVG